jgi:hypothetical protein
MKKNSQGIWIAAAAVVGVGALGIWGYEVWFAATVISPGTMQVPTPGSGNIAFALPAGAQSWAVAGYTSLTGTNVALTVPSSPTTHLQVTGAVQGGIVAISWVDSTGTTQATSVTFT